MKVLLFDFDGTLGYRDGMWTDTFFSLLIKHNIHSIEKRDLRPLLNIGYTWSSPDSPHRDLFKGKTWWEYYEDYFCEILSLFGIGAQQSKNIASEFRAEYMDKTKWHLFSDILPLLKKSQQNGFTNIILSNHIPELETIVDYLGISELFFKIYSSGLLGYEKPNKEIFNHVVNDLGIERKNIIMIGDNYRADIGGALRSQIKAILVRKENDKDYRWYCPDLTQLPDVLKELGFDITAAAI